VWQAENPIRNIVTQFSSLVLLFLFYILSYSSYVTQFGLLLVLLFFVLIRGGGGGGGGQECSHKVNTSTLLLAVFRALKLNMTMHVLTAIA
jgi:hypothetical protein